MTPWAAVGAAVVDITPPPGLLLAGFAARTQPATGAHDALTARALAVDETVVAIADVIGLHEDSCARIHAACGLPPGALVLAATHTHGAPVSMPGRVGADADPGFLRQLEQGLVAAISAARAARRPARLKLGAGADPGVARNRRHPGGNIDPALPVLLAEDAAGRPIAVLVCHACHPVVVGPHNRQMTADYPGFVRTGLEAAFPGAVALFLTGCAGDANTGHSAAASLRLEVPPTRTFEAAAAVAARIVDAAVRAAPEPVLPGSCTGRALPVTLETMKEATAIDVLERRWRGWAPEAGSAEAAQRRCWLAWAAGPGRAPATPFVGRVAALRWGSASLAALPGEIFAQTAHELRAAAPDMAPIVAGYADACPGYIPPAGEYAHGGYEVEEAHRYFGMPGPFAPGSAERLRDAAIALLDGLAA